MVLAKGQARFELAADQPPGHVYYSPPQPIVRLLTPPMHKGSEPVFYPSNRVGAIYLTDDLT